jgi:hypothetical protein
MSDRTGALPADPRDMPVKKRNRRRERPMARGCNDALSFDVPGRKLA